SALFCRGAIVGTPSRVCGVDCVRTGADMTLKRPEEFDHFTAALPDLDVHYVRQGSGPILMLWHGWPGFWWD
ncbi:MAG TPA: hypothetical protein VKD72_01330, partial [Gemmataceae bacterium]|nr:hypothetical protein [Gemmataceae bacterium]